MLAILLRAINVIVLCLDIVLELLHLRVKLVQLRRNLVVERVDLIELPGPSVFNFSNFTGFTMVPAGCLSRTLLCETETLSVKLSQAIQYRRTI